MFVRGRIMQYSKKTLNMMLGVKKKEDSYQSLFKNLDKIDLEAIRDSLCLPVTNWIEIK